MKNNKISFICIGAIHIDYNMHLKYNYLVNRTNPVILLKTLGGVAYNISNQLRLYSNNINLLSLKINKKLLLELSKKNIKFINLSKKIYERSYTTVLNINGKMIFGLADTEAYEKIKIEHKKIKFFRNKNIILDLNFSSNTIKQIINNNYKNNNIMVCGTSALKIYKIYNLLNKIHFISLNYQEFLILTKKTNIKDAIRYIKRKYKHLTVAITNGSKKIRCIYKNNVYEANCPKTSVKNENTAGDIFSSFFFAEICSGSSIEESLKKAVSAGCLFVKGIILNNNKTYRKQISRISKKINIKKTK